MTVNGIRIILYTGLECYLDKENAIQNNIVIYYPSSIIFSPFIKLTQGGNNSAATRNFEKQFCPFLLVMDVNRYNFDLL